MKRTYHIPTIEIVSLLTSEMMAFDLGGSGSHGQAQAPARFAPVPDGGVKAF